MVLTCCVRVDETAQTEEPTRFTRRRLLRGSTLLMVAAGTLSAAGCGLLDDGPTPEPSPDPLAPLLTEALELADRHAAAASTFGTLAARLGPIAEAHRSHAAELSRVTGITPPSPGASSALAVIGPAAATLAELRAAEQMARASAVAACLAAPADRAALAGSIAAARACHAEVLR